MEQGVTPETDVTPRCTVWEGLLETVDGADLRYRSGVCDHTETMDGVLRFRV